MAASVCDVERIRVAETLRTINRASRGSYLQSYKVRGMKLSTWLFAGSVAVLLSSCIDQRASRLAEASAFGSSLGPLESRPAGGSKFAALPDQGRLTATDKTRMRKITGDFTWDPVKVSEAHALNTIGGGSLVFVMPDGKQLAVGYQRHVEHPDGNWTWIGRGPDGEDAVITFGRDAVFGSVQHGNRTLRIATTAGGAWLVSTRPGADVEPWRDGGDALLPPTRPMLQVPSRPVPAMAGTERKTLAASAEEVTVVDVVVGYTNGFAAARGGDSAARTRVNNLIEITNQAYANSQLAPRVRLVMALPVTYPDATDNGVALDALSGVKVAVDPALQPLRAARDQYGGDLVVLLRDFQTPENDGCGIAWLIGGGSEGIQVADQTYGYSVVGDGTDVDETDGKTYGCREETFAHELGHGMGQTHNIEDSTTTGAHPYSYGYRHPAEDAFYTVMAYRITGSRQFAIRYFGNPAVGYQNAASTYNGAPTGVANASDNVSSMRLTMPVVAQFREATVPTPVAPRLMDFNGDGYADIFWRNQVLQQADWWSMQGVVRKAVNSKGVGSQYRVAAIADFSGDGRSDVLWEDGATLWLWRAESTGGFSIQFIAGYPAGSWTIAGAGDLNADGKADIVWSNRTLQQADWWYMNGAERVGVGSKFVAQQYRIAGVADFSGDGRADILWVDATSMWLWRTESSGTMTVQGIGGYPAGDWAIVGVGDIDGNGRADIFWNSKTMNQADWWLMDGATRVAATGASVDARYSVAALADYTGDGRADVLWQDGSTIWMWQAEANGGFSVRFVDQYPQGGWQIAR